MDMEIVIMPFGMYQELEYGRRLLVVLTAKPWTIGNFAFQGMV